MSLYFDNGPNPRRACRPLCYRMSCLECCGCTNGCEFCELVQNCNSEMILLETQYAVVVRSQVPEGQIHLLVIPKRHLDGNLLGVEDVPLLNDLAWTGQTALFNETSQLGLSRVDCNPRYAFRRRPGKHMVLNVVVNPVKIEDYFTDPTTGEYRDNVILLDDLIRSFYSPSV